MRILGIDYGTKRVGIAMTDPDCKFSVPFSVVKNSPSLSKEIEKLAEKNDVSEIVLGESKDYKGRPNAIYDQTQKLKHYLECKGFTVHFEPEFLTSAQAERLQGKNEMTDASAAALILQSYLDRTNSKC